MLEEFLQGYIEAALFCEGESDRYEEEDRKPDGCDFYVTDLTPECEKKMREDCWDFLRANLRDILVIGDMARAGNDFWYTRCGHGVGYWDRGLGDVGDRLTAAAQVYHGVDLYVIHIGQERKLHCL